MTAVRFTLMNPDRVTHLVLEDPLGLDRLPRRHPAAIRGDALRARSALDRPGRHPQLRRGVLRASRPARYGSHSPTCLVRVTLSPDYPRWARAAALTFQMIYQQPVRYEYHLIAPPTLLIVGAEDHVVPLGQYAHAGGSRPAGRLRRAVRCGRERHTRATRVVVPDCGHIPHLEQPEQFLAAFLPFLAS